tara:strand:+ start:1649 stop:2137 length:489 start_codon:yes stop_codon:yes gene_type:complete
MSNKKILLQSNIELAIKNTQSNMAAAKFLRVSYNTYKKYAEMYFDKEGTNLFEKHKNQYGYGISRIGINSPKKLEDIFAGKYPKYPLYKLKIRLFREGMLAEECSCCKFSERRLTDYQIPILLNQIDGNKDNYTLDNLEVLCYNCYFLQVGNISGKRKEIDM